ncbi:hypothetical protein AgCh_024285 [Apium graveolens]
MVGAFVALLSIDIIDSSEHCATNGRPRKDEIVISSDTFAHVSLPEKRPVDDIIDGDNGEDFNNDAVENDAVMCVVDQVHGNSVYFASDVVEKDSTASQISKITSNGVQFVVASDSTKNDKDNITETKPGTHKRIRINDNEANKKNKSKIV